jgi:H+/gluconate symporter-like permease
MFFEYTLPLILLGIAIAIWVTCVIIGKIIIAWEKRQKKLHEKYFEEKEGAE